MYVTGQKLEEIAQNVQEYKPNVKQTTRIEDIFQIKIQTDFCREIFSSLYWYVSCLQSFICAAISIDR